MAKRSARTDKQIYTDNLAEEAQNAAEVGNMRTEYRVTKILGPWPQQKACKTPSDPESQK